MILPQFYLMILTQFGSSIQRFRTNNVRDYFNHILHNFFNEKGVVHEFSYINTLQQNGVVERKMRHLLNVTRTRLHHSNVPKKFWREAVLTAAYLINRMPSKLLSYNSLFQCLISHFPHLNFHTPLPLGIFGCVAFVHIPHQARDKLDPRALRCIFLGYSPTQKGYKYYHHLTRKFSL